MGLRLQGFFLFGAGKSANWRASLLQHHEISSSQRVTRSCIQNGHKAARRRRRRRNLHTTSRSRRRSKHSERLNGTSYYTTPQPPREAATHGVVPLPNPAFRHGAQLRTFAKNRFSAILSVADHGAVQFFLSGECRFDHEKRIEKSNPVGCLRDKRSEGGKSFRRN